MGLYLGEEYKKGALSQEIKKKNETEEGFFLSVALILFYLFFYSF